MDLFEAMMTQKSIRRYNDEPVSDDEIRQCLKAAVQAPNGGNSQPWEWLVVRDDEKKRAIGEWYRKAFHERYWPAITRLAANNAQAVSEKARKAGERTAASAIHLADHLGEAEALVMLIGARAERDWELHDDQGPVDIGRTYYTSLVPALQNFMLAARGLGIGTCLTTLFRVHQQEIREICGIPDAMEIEALVPMGRPRGNFGIAPRIPAEQRTSWDTWGERRR